MDPEKTTTMDAKVTGRATLLAALITTGLVRFAGDDPIRRDPNLVAAQEGLARVRTFVDALMDQVVQPR